MNTLSSDYQNKLNRYNQGHCSPFAFKLGNELQEGMQINTQTYFTSDFYTINDLACFCIQRSANSQKDCGPYFNITFTRLGYFTFNTFPKSVDGYTASVFLKKPNCEFTITQMTNQPFACTIFNFSDTFLNVLQEEYKTNIRFFLQSDVFAQQLIVTPELEYLHYTILEEIQKKDASKLFVDCMVVEILDTILDRLKANTPKTLDLKFKGAHWSTVERAKHYLSANFITDISLKELANYCCVSPFHFTRIFKEFTGYTPYNFLLELRLKHSEILLKTTSSTSISDICFSSGFSSPDYFSTVFSKKFKMSPTKYRMLKAA